MEDAVGEQIVTELAVEPAGLVVDLHVGESFGGVGDLAEGVVDTVVELAGALAAKRILRFLFLPVVLELPGPFEFLAGGVSEHLSDRPALDRERRLYGLLGLSS